MRQGWSAARWPRWPSTSSACSGATAWSACYCRWRSGRARRKRCGARKPPARHSCAPIRRQRPRSELGELEAVEIVRGLEEQRGLLALAAIGSEALEGVEDHPIAGLALVGWKVALEHAAIHPKSLDAGFDIGLPCCGRLLGAWRLRPFMKAEARQHHGEPAELHHHVRAFRHLLDRGLPGLEDFVAAAGIAADADDAAAMIEADPRARKGAGEIGEFAELMIEQPAIEAEVQRRQAGKTLAKGRIEQQALRPLRIDAGDILVGIPGRRVANAAEAAVAGGDLGFQHRLCAVAEQEIGVADDAMGDQRLAIGAARRHRGRTVDE